MFFINTISKREEQRGHNEGTHGLPYQNKLGGEGWGEETLVIAKETFCHHLTSLWYAVYTHIHV